MGALGDAAPLRRSPIDLDDKAEKLFQECRERRSRKARSGEPPRDALRGCEKTVASGPRARRTERSDETYQIDRRGASTAQRRYRVV